MKTKLIIPVLLIILLSACRKDVAIIPIADFSFRSDTASVLKMATYDTCTLFNSSTNADSSYWDLGNGTVSKQKNLVLSYPVSGTYQVKLTVRNNNGTTSTTTRKVIVLDRVLKRIIIRSVYWDTIPNRIPYFNAVWPTTSRADIFVTVQKYSPKDSVVPYSGMLPNSPILYQSPVIPNIASDTKSPIYIDVPGKFIVDKKMVLDRTFAISLLAKDAGNTVYKLMGSLSSGSDMGIYEESIPNNRFVVRCSLMSSVELECAFE